MTETRLAAMADIVRCESVFVEWERGEGEWERDELN